MPETVSPLSPPAVPADQRASTHRLAVVISHPIQHFVPLFVRLSQTADVQLKVFYCCDWGVREYADPGFGKSFAWDIPLLEGYNSEFLSIRRRPKSLSFFEVDNPLVSERLAAFAPDAVWVHGYAHRTSWRVLRWARKNSVAVLYFGDSELLSQRGRIAKLAKRLVLPIFFRQCDGFLTIGDNNEDYYRHYGIPDKKLYRGAFPVDLDRFRQSISSLSAEDRRRLRSEKGLSADAVVVLFVGKLIDIKRPLDFVEAIARLRGSTSRIEGLIVGSGPLEPQIRRQIHERDLADQIKMTGFVNQSEMPQVLWLGDILAMCSEKDPHPLAVSEAMAVGNAIVASDRVGCVGPTDAARPGRNALTYPCGDVDSLAARLQTLALNGQQREAMRNESWQLAQFQDVQVAAGAVMRFLQESVCQRK